ncbi:MAG TPA: ABC transporter ATP-binding protein [Alphaproteobacteria bacterium]|nr:ABC transporter ATP-binding protein [Alphaproteobacteria bacterium]
MSSAPSNLISLNLSATAAGHGQAARPAPKDRILRMEGIQKVYGGSIAVENTNLELYAGEILTLLGPSGCGKTTTLRLAIGLERATKGRIWFKDRLVDAPEDKVFVSPEKRDMGMVFQSYAIWPHMDVFGNVAYPLRVRRRKADEIRREVEKALDLVGLSGFSNRPGTKLSGGQMQRVAVARGLVFGPDLLLMDEPFSNLDAKLRDQMRSELKLLQRRLGISVLFVTHDQSEALALSDRIAVMQAGRIEQSGDPKELYYYPQTVAVRDFLGRTLNFNARIMARAHGNLTTVELDGGTICDVSGADHTSSAAVHSRCIASIRPEHVKVAPRGAESLAAGQVAGEILTLLFIGDRYEASIRLGNGMIATLYLPCDENWAEGQAVKLQLPAERLQLWKSEGAQ